MISVFSSHLIKEKNGSSYLSDTKLAKNNIESFWSGSVKGRLIHESQVISSENVQQCLWGKKQILIFRFFLIYLEYVILYPV